MARPAKMWLREADGCWYVTHRGKKVKLGPDKAEAGRAFHALKAHALPAAREECGPRPSLRRLVGLYLDLAERTKTAATYTVQRRYLVGFCEFVGDRKAPDVRVPDVKDWLAANRRWGESTRALAVSTVIALFNWAVEEQRLAVSPVKGIKRGRFNRRERIVPAGHRSAVLAHVTPGLADFLRLLALTGCRPFSELGKLTAADIDFAGGLVLPAAHKTANKGRPRVIVLVPEAVDILRRLAGEHPAGPLLRTSYGNPWTRQAVNRALQAAAAKAGLPKYSSYDLRRTFITDGLAKGLTANVMAQLAGNTPATINKFYDSLHLRLDALKAAARTVTE